MKNEKKERIWRKTGFIILFIYINLVLWGQYSLLDSIFPSLGIFALNILLSAFLSWKAVTWVGNIKIGVSDEVYDVKNERKLFLSYFIITLALLTVYFIARYPGIHCLDTMNQLQQVADGSYDDWHPVLQTLLVLAIPYKLFGLPATTYVQLLFFSAALAYMMSAFYRYSMKKRLRIIIYCLFMVNPLTGYMMMIPWKDSTFTILTMLLATAMLEIVYSEGSRLKSVGFLVFVGIVLGVCTLVRHNAILFTAPFMLCLIVMSKNFRKRSFCVIGIALLLILSVKGILYKAIGVEKPNQRVVETTGMCMVMMGNAYVTNPECMSDDVIEFLESVKTADFWEVYYKLGDWNHVKWSDEDEVLDDMDSVGAKTILSYTLDTFKNCPEPSIRAFLAVTGMVWKVDGDVPWSECLERYDNNFVTGSTYRYDISAVYENYKTSAFGEWLTELLDQYREIVKNSFLRYLFYYAGIYDAILLVLAVAYMVRRMSIKPLLLIAPVMVYNFGTAVLLSGYDWRFFYYTFPCLFVLAFALQKKDGDACETA